VRATIDGVLLADADSDHIISIEGSRYFPPDSLTIGTLKDSPTPYVCPWKRSSTATMPKGRVDEH
jgi:uncharacterized protein (DUF427 family)